MQGTASITYLQRFSPPLHVSPQYPAIVGHQTVDLAFHVSSLRPYSTSARVKLNLSQQLIQQVPTTQIPRVKIFQQLVSLVDFPDSPLDLPEMLS